MNVIEEMAVSEGLDRLSEFPYPEAIFGDHNNALLVLGVLQETWDRVLVLTKRVEELEYKVNHLGDEEWI